MPLTVSPIKKAIVKRALKQGKSARQALKEANYSPGIISRSTANVAVKDSIEEITNELKASDLTPDMIVNGLNDIRTLCITGNKKDLSSAVRIHELWGKYLKMWADNLNQNIIVNTPQAQFNLSERVENLKKQQNGV